MAKAIPFVTRLNGNRRISPTTLTIPNPAKGGTQWKRRSTDRSLPGTKALGKVLFRRRYARHSLAPADSAQLPGETMFPKLILTENGTAATTLDRMPLASGERHEAWLRVCLLPH